jgi:hypothetical protein
MLGLMQLMEFTSYGSVMSFQLYRQQPAGVNTNSITSISQTSALEEEVRFQVMVELQLRLVFVGAI